MSALFPRGKPFGVGHKAGCPCDYCAPSLKVGDKITLNPELAKIYGFDRCTVEAVYPPPKPVVFLPLMRIPAPPEKGTRYLPEMWRPNDG